MTENGRKRPKWGSSTNVHICSFWPKSRCWQSARDCRCPSLQVDDPAPRGMRDRVRASGCVQLVDHTADVEFGCIRRDAKPATDLLIGQSLGEESDHIAFARGERLLESAIGDVRSEEHTSELQSLMRI